MDIDVRNMPVVLNLISDELSNGNTVEVKMERDYIAVVRTERKLLLRIRADDEELKK